MFPIWSVLSKGHALNYVFLINLINNKYVCSAGLVYLSLYNSTVFCYERILFII